MATLTDGRRINVGNVNHEIARLKMSWRYQSTSKAGDTDVLSSVFTSDKINELDRFDQIQLAEVIRVCRESKTLSDAGRKLFAVSRTRRKIANDADRVRKYLGKFELSWDKIQ